MAKLFLLLFACRTTIKIEAPAAPLPSIGTIDSRASLLSAYHHLDMKEFDQAFSFFQQAQQSDPSNLEIENLWKQSLCEYPVAKRHEAWTKLKNSLDNQHSPPSCQKE